MRIESEVYIDWTNPRDWSKNSTVRCQPSVIAFVAPRTNHEESECVWWREGWRGDNRVEVSFGWFWWVWFDLIEQQRNIIWFLFALTLFRFHSNSTLIRFTIVCYNNCVASICVYQYWISTRGVELDSSVCKTLLSFYFVFLAYEIVIMTRL